MSFGEVANCLLIIFVVLTNGMPQNDATTQTEEKPEALPFIQFTNGGIRLNFGGYHAEAGLGGLLRGTGGGLHAGVGTPWGAHAGAGLGGNINGTDGSLGGGLYARAGLGRGRPEAAAGLGGRLDGRSANPISGGLYAGATPGGGPGPGVYLGGGYADGRIDGAASGSADAGATVRPRTSGNEETGSAAASETKGRTNIQIIPSRARNAQKEKEKAVEAAAPPADARAGGQTKESQDKEIRRDVSFAAVPLAKVSLVGSVGVAPLVKSIEKTVAVSPVVVAVPEVVPTVQTNTVTKVKVDTIPRPTHSRWYVRKRFWAAPRKVVYVAPTVIADSQDSPSEVVSKMYADATGDGGTVVATKIYTSGSLFDDIFNIPISTLSAVNQLLNNIG